MKTKMYNDCADECKAHEEPTRVGLHLADCGIAIGAAALLTVRHGSYIKGHVEFAGVQRPAILFEDKEIRGWVAGTWVRLATEMFEEDV